MNSKRVIATDLPEILEITRANIQLNGCDNMPTLQTQALEWGNYEHIRSFDKETFDFIICCECLYEQAPWEKLLETLLLLCREQSRIVFAYKKRYKSQELFLSEATKHFDIKELPRECIHIEFRSDYNYRIMIMKLK